MAPGPATLLSVGFLLLLAQGGLANKGPASLPVRVTVENDLSNLTPESYAISMVEGGVLIGAMRRLQDTQQGFKFTVKEHPDFGPFLESVNGVAGDENENTYWELLSESYGEYTRLDVGIGCYTPKENEHIILRFSSWSPNSAE
ncbi:cobalamin binding intrinsic factor-like isoform 1-T2 [Odontesthes bonariensis]|uniref:cobalamin binding intrinsic factor-like n=1 Tax=Odontesthes bonariensis TaxID=219752 RepID=UPI003F581A5A